MIKTTKFAKRCPQYRNAFDSIKLCTISVVKNDGSTQTINTHSSFLQLDKSERLETKVKLLAEYVCGLTGLQSYTYQVV